jgi:hypothetical protein
MILGRNKGCLEMSKPPPDPIVAIGKSLFPPVSDAVLNLSKDAQKAQVLATIMKGPPQKNSARAAEQAIIRAIAVFESQLGSEEETGARWVSGPEGTTFHLESVKADGSEILVFDGKSVKGTPIRIVQHYTQTNLVLERMPARGKEARRIGFDLSGAASGEKSK